MGRCWSMTLKAIPHLGRKIASCFVGAVTPFQASKRPSLRCVEVIGRSRLEWLCFGASVYSPTAIWSLPNHSSCINFGSNQRRKVAWVRSTCAARCLSNTPAGRGASRWGSDLGTRASRLDLTDARCRCGEAFATDLVRVLTRPTNRHAHSSPKTRVLSSRRIGRVSSSDSTSTVTRWSPASTPSTRTR